MLFFLDNFFNSFSFEYVLIFIPPNDDKYFSNRLFFKTYTVLFDKDVNEFITKSFSCFVAITNEIFSNEFIWV